MDMFKSVKQNSISIDASSSHKKNKALNKSQSDTNIIRSPLRFSKRSHKYTDLKQSAAIIANESKIKKIQDECTFTPSISEKLDRSNVRSAQQFYKDQRQLELKKAVRIYLLEKKAFKKINGHHRPRLSQTTEELAMKRNFNDPSIHNRLHQDSAMKKMRYEAQLQDCNKLTRQKSNEPKSRYKIEDYQNKNPVLRRRSRYALILNILEMKMKCKSRHQYQSFQVNKSDSYAFRKLIKDLEFAWKLILKEINSRTITEILEPQRTEGAERVDIKTAAYIFTALGYLSTQGKEDDEEKNLFYDLWTLLQGEESNGVTFDSLKRILLTITGFYKGVDVKYDNTNMKSNVTYVKIGSIMNEDFTD